MKASTRAAAFLHGFGSVIELFPKKRNVLISLSSQSSADSLKKDWEIIGHDMWSVIDDANKEVEK
jgi:hypothetical protein